VAPPVHCGLAKWQRGALYAVKRLNLEATGSERGLDLRPDGSPVEPDDQPLPSLTRAFEELNVGELAPLDDALPELKAAKPFVLLQAEVGREVDQAASATSDAVLASSEISAVGHSGP
jgi:hypothetical protein